MNSRPILCVDDEPANLALLRQVLQPHYPLVFARSGGDALLAMEKHKPAMVLLDVELGDMNGFDICRKLKAGNGSDDIPVIFVTGLSDAVDEQAGFDAGGVDYITKPISPPVVIARVRTHLSLVRTSKLEESYRAAIHMLGEAGHYNDHDTGVHIWRMAAYSKRLAEAAGWPQERAELLELAAPMHDTGKIGIPDAILKKPGPLTPEEWTIMKTHASIGHSILGKSDSPVFQLASEIALRHHERWDGSGYPDGLTGEEIPESARIVAVADVFDALCMKRAYKDAWPVEQVVATILESAGTHLDPRMVELFTAVLPDILQVKEHWNAQEKLMAAERES